MVKRQHVASVALFAVLLAAGSPAQAQQPDLTKSQMREFLLTAQVVAAERSSTGTTQPWRLTLSDGTLTHDAAFQPVDRREGVRRFGDRVERNFVDSYRYNLAAYRLTELLGLDDMMPVFVERTWNGQTGSLSWWVDDVMFSELTRLEQRNWPDDMARWSAQMSRMLVFAELVQDSDRNQGNILYTSDWTLYMIDFSRAFRTRGELDRPGDLFTVDRELFERLPTLTKDGIEAATDPYLTGGEIDALLERRDRLVEHFSKLIEEKGEARVLN